jgi:hypothetical protein
MGTPSKVIFILVSVTFLASIISFIPGTNDTTSVEVSKVDEVPELEVDRFTDGQTVTESGSHKLVVRGQLVSRSGTVTGLNKTVEKEGDKIVVSVSQQKPDYGPKTGIPQVISITPYKIEIVGTLYKYDKIEINGQVYQSDDNENQES